MSKHLLDEYPLVMCRDEEHRLYAIGFDGHIVKRTEIDALYAELMPFFETHSDKVIDALDIEFDNSRLAQEATKKPSATCQGYVYLLFAENGMYKIGVSAQLDKRIKCLNVKLPVSISLVAAYKADDMFSDEQQWHNRFAESRIIDGGEWFNLGQDEVNEFMAKAERREVNGKS
jgi:hypothetical protein